MKCEYMNECEITDKNGVVKMYSFRNTGASAKYKITFLQTINGETSEHSYNACKSCVNDIVSSCENNMDNDISYQVFDIEDLKTGKSMGTTLI